MTRIESDMKERLEEVIQRAVAEAMEITREEIAGTLEQALFRMRPHTGGEAEEGGEKRNGNGHGLSLREREEREEERKAEIEAEAKPAKKAGKKSAKAEKAAAAAEVVYEFVKENPKLRSEEIQKRLAEKLPGNVVKATLTKFRDEGKVKTKGNRRATVYTVA